MRAVEAAKTEGDVATEKGVDRSRVMLARYAWQKIKKKMPQAPFANPMPGPSRISSAVPKCQVPLLFCRRMSKK